MELLKDTLNAVMRDLEVKNKGVNDTDPGECLKKILTKKELGHIKVKYFNKGILGLNVDSSAWLYAINLKKEKITSFLKDKNPALKSIRFNIGEV
jgi:hypothetical protein